MYDMKIIKKRIIDLNKTQKEIAQYLGITEVTLSKWVNGDIGNIEKFIKLYQYLDIDIREIKKSN